MCAMETAFQACKILSIAAFLFYGALSLRSQAMVAEFARYGLSGFRVLTRTLEVLGGLGILTGYVWPPLVIVSSGGLSLLMLFGIAARARIRDPLVAMLPAFVLFAVNGFIAGYALWAS